MMEGRTPRCGVLLTGFLLAPGWASYGGAAVACGLSIREESYNEPL